MNYKIIGLLCLSILQLNTNIMAQSSIHDFKAKGLTGSEINFADFKGKKIIIVNTASECGYTPQYELLQELYTKNSDKVVIVGFPANNFGKQEPGSDEEIQTFCKKNYGVTFPMAAKVSVKGDDINPLFAWLCSQETPDFSGDIKWNFEKFVFDENGKLIRRFRSDTKPNNKEIIDLIR